MKLFANKFGELNLSKIHNLLLNCVSSRDLYLCLIDIDYTNEVARLMSENFCRVTHVTRLSKWEKIGHREYRLIDERMELV